MGSTLHCVAHPQVESGSQRHASRPHETLPLTGEICYNADMGTAFATTRFLSRNSHLGKYSRKARHRWGFRSVTQRTHWGSSNLAYESHRRCLIGRTVTTYGTGGTTTTQRYVFDGTNMVLAFDANDNLTDRYLWGPAVDQVLADEHFSYSSGSNQLPSSPGTTLWALGDNQNTVRDVVEDNGTLEQHIAYSPFGQQVSGLTTTGSVVANFAFGYTGTYTDPVTNLQLHGVRWYNPGSQRWLTQDPLGLGPDTNPYRYCGNGPTDGIDPSGLKWRIKRDKSERIIGAVAGDNDIPPVVKFVPLD